MLSFKEVAEEVSSYVGESGVCADDPRVLKAVNRARRLLYELGNWKGVTSDMVIQSYDGTITLPPAYEYITKSWTSVRNMIIPNEHFTIITNGFREQCGGMCQPNKVNEPVACFRDFGMVNREDCFYRVEVMFESDREADGTEVILHGYNKQGNRAILPRFYVTGMVGVTHSPQSFDMFVRSIYQATKPATQGRVRVYGYIPDTDKRVLCAIYEKDDINPTMQRYRISSHRSGQSQYLVTAKRRYRPIVNDTDLVDIHTDALIHTLQGLTDRDSRNINGFNANLTMATQFLNRQLGQEDSFKQSRIRGPGPDVTNLNG